MVSIITTSITNISFCNHRDPLHALLHCTEHWRCTKPLKKLENGGGDDDNDDDGSWMKKQVNTE